jgi:hypothetical protein
MKEKNVTEKKTTQPFITQPANTDHLTVIKEEKPLESIPVVETKPLVNDMDIPEAPLRPGQVITPKIKAKPIERNAFKQNRSEIEYEHDEYSEIVTGTIINHEQPGNPVEFWFRGNGCPDITKFEFADNAYVKMQVGVAEHLNKNCWINKDKDGINEVGKPVIVMGSQVRRYTFYPSGYFGPVDLKPVGVPMLPLYKQ